MVFPGSSKPPTGSTSSAITEVSAAAIPSRRRFSTRASSPAPSEKDPRSIIGIAADGSACKVAD